MEHKQDEQDVTASITVTPAVEREWLKQDKIIYGALSGAGLILVQPFLYNGQFKGVPAKVAVVAFAIAIPMLAALILLNEEEIFRKHPSKSRVVATVRVLGQAAAFVGFVAAFWHIDKIAGISAIVASVIGMGAHSAGYTKLNYAKLYKSPKK